jgi:two-component system, NarL family, nitrate/nitrite response regulator NarL
MKTIIIDDSPSIRDNLEIYLQTELNIEVITTFERGEDFLDYKYSYNADFILMDICMPGIDGLVTAKNFLWKYPKQTIIAVTMYYDKAYLKQLIEVGIKGCVFKDQIYTDLYKAINTVTNGGLYFPKNMEI